MNFRSDDVIAFARPTEVCDIGAEIGRLGSRAGSCIGAIVLALRNVASEHLDAIDEHHHTIITPN